MYMAALLWYAVLLILIVLRITINSISTSTITVLSYTPAPHILYMMPI